MGAYLTELYGADYQSKVVSDGGFVSCIEGVNEEAMPARLFCRLRALPAI